ncbi:MAG: mannose-1-phosphate guanylyltransferase [Bacteroidia bacterium]
MNKNHYIIIMAGGIGTRFWPISRKHFPKQFMDILGTGKSLITQTYERFTQVVPEENIYIVANGEYTPLIKEHIPSITEEQILKEPLGKNTAPCIAYASYCLQQKNPDAVCMVAPSDHLITNEALFAKTAQQALEFAADSDALVTLGIQPSRPDTGYGYIQFIEDSNLGEIKEVKTFTEKPNAEIAQTFIDSKEFLWNAGIFAWSIKSICTRFEQKLNKIHTLFSEIKYQSNNVEDLIERAYGQCPSISIDYGIMEKDENVFVIPSNFGWSDLGTWKSLWDVTEKDEHQNSMISKQTMSYDSQDNLVYSSPDKLVVINGVDNLVIVDSEEVLLVMNKDKEQEIKGIVNDVKSSYKGKYN